MSLWGQTFGSYPVQMKKLWPVLLICNLAVYSQETFPSGPRSAALGTCSVALKDSWCTVNNQAGLGTSSGFSCAILYQNLFFIKELSTRGITLLLPFQPLSLGFSMTSFGYPLYHENKYNLAFGKAFSDKLSLGAAFNYLHTQIAGEISSSSAFAGELGMLAQLQEKLLLGVHLSNPTRSLHGKGVSEQLPTVLRLGINYSFSSSVSVLAETTKDLSRKASFKGGLEYQPLHGFFLRTGVCNSPQLYSFGIGWCIQQLRVDLSISRHPLLGISSQVGLNYIFFDKKPENVRHDR
jgi:hypothetical protein